MKCVLLQAPGETLEGLAEMNGLGFECQAYPVSQEVGLLRDTRYEDFARFMGRIPGWLDKPAARSLRVSFAKMLTDPAFADDDLIIFGESDATPTVAAEILRPVIEKELRLHPETDVFRPFLELATVPSHAPDQPFQLMFEPLHTASRTRDSVYVWGTHALVIPAKSRRKIADIFLDWRLPIDNALEAACAEGKLNMRVCRHNLFYQKPRTTTADATRLYSWRKRRMALCLASYKRPEDLQRQIYALMDQSYDNFHLFVAVKGIPDFFVNTFIIPQFQHFIDEGRLTIRCFPNGNQLANLLDTVRGIDVSEYELFLKIDDDDFYCRDYLKTINEFYTRLPQHYSCYFSDMTWRLYKYDRIVSPRREMFYVFGSSLVMSREVMQRTMQAESDPDIIRRTMALDGGSGHSRIAFMEDNFIHKLMRIYGCSNIAPFVRQRGIQNFLLSQGSNPSVMRGGLVPSDIARHLDVAEKNAPKEHVFFLMHPEWTDTLRIYGRSAHRVSSGDRASVVSFDGSELALRWEKWDEEIFVRQPDGSYRLK